jgi:hypothetical protein
VAKKILLVILMFIIAAFAVSAADISQYADRLNYWDTEQHTITVTNNCAGDSEVNITIPVGFAYNSGTCTNPSAGLINCIILSGSSKTYTVNSSSSTQEYKISTFSAVTNNTCTTSNTSLIRIHPSEIFHTLVEYGRGRGNYFFDSYKGMNLSGSGRTEQGCTYLPDNTALELNYLHKILNIKQYYESPLSNAYNASFTCTYPNVTIVRQHLTTAINNLGSFWLVDYFISEIEGSWERMAYLAQDFDVGELTAGNTIIINCTNIAYKLPDMGGDIFIEEDSFTLTVVDKEPFTVTALSPAGTVVGNGTQEVVLMYSITNTAPYPVSDVIIEIEAPPYAAFIGTRGELWGYGLDQYRIEKTELLPGQTETIYLVARFDTSTAGNINNTLLTNGVKISYITCWEANAYNPSSYMQRIYTGANVTVNMSLPTNATNIINILININTTTSIIQQTTFNINNTVNDIFDWVQVINQSTWNISYQVWNFYSRNLTYYPPANFNATFIGGTGGGAGGGVACRWNKTEWYNNSLSNTNSYQVYQGRWLKVDFPGIYNGSVDAWRTCYRIAPSSAAPTAIGTDVLQVYMCNNYDGSGEPETEAGCTLIKAYDIYSGMFTTQSTQFKWECAEILGKEINGKNISIAFECPGCSGAADGWYVALDDTNNLNYTSNSTNDGSIWSNSAKEALVEWDWCVPIDFGYEVWHYNNRSITEICNCTSPFNCNLTAILDQFNCTQGPDTNKICEMLAIINETTQNTWNTVVAINSTVNIIEGDVIQIKNDTNTIIDLLNCNTTVDTPICGMLIEINGSIYHINVTVTDIQNQVNNINNTLYLMNGSIYTWFNYTWSLFKNVTVNIGNISLTMNCSDPLNMYPGSVCEYLQKIENNTITINNTINNVYDIVYYINGTRWGNVTAWDIYNKIVNLTQIVENNYHSIINHLEMIQQFDEELVFLVTDSFGLQQQAKTDVGNGNLVEAATKLKEANDKLSQAALRLVELQNDQTSTQVTNQTLTSTTGKDNTLVLILLLMLMCIMIVVYLVVRPPMGRNKEKILTDIKETSESADNVPEAPK